MSDEGQKKPEAEEDEEENEEDLEKLQEEIARMEAEAARITKETEELEKKKEAKLAATGSSGDDTKSGPGTSGETPNRDGYSIYVGQVDYSATPEELLSHFEACGTVERVTIVCDKFTGKPKGFAYLEFSTEKAVDNAVKLDGSEFKGRQLKVSPKRVNIAGFNHQQEGGGGRAGGRGRGGFRGGRGRGGFRGGGRGYRGGYRGGRGGYHPYY